MPGKNAKMVPSSLFRKDSKLQEIFQKLQSSVDKNKLSSLKNVPEKVNFISEIPEISDLQISLKKEPKWNLETSLELKELGNKLYKEGNYRDAREAYTRSLQFYPKKPELMQNAEYSIILANRSAVSSALYDFKACSQDIDYAFKYGYPKNLQFKIYHRKGHALLKLKQFVESKAAFNKCLDMIGKSDMPSKQRDQFRLKTKKQMTVFNVVKQLYNQDISKRPDPELAAKPLTPTPELSSKLSINEQEVRVAKAVNVLDALIKECPLVKVVNDESKGKICPVTFEEMVAPIPCSYGSSESFRSEEAREIANNSFHRYEWNSVEHLVEMGLTPLARLALRLITSTEDWAKLDTGKLLDEEVPLEILMLATIYLKILKQAQFGPISGGQLAENTCKAILIALQNSIRIQSPVLPQTRESIFDKMSSFPTKNLGCGIFPVVSRISRMKFVQSNSDEPSLFSYYINNKLVLQANRDLVPGEHVTFNVGNKNGSTEVINDMITFRCSNDNCKVGFPLKENTKEKLIKCPMENCQKETNIWLKLKRIQELKQLYIKNLENLKRAEKRQDGIKGLIHLQHEWERIIFRPYKDIGQIERNLQFCVLLSHAEEEEKFKRGFLS